MSNVKTAENWVKERMFEMAKQESTSAGGWEAVEDMAHMKIKLDYDHYFIAAMCDYLATQPYPPTPVEESSK